MLPKTSYARSVVHARIRSYAISRFSCHHILHLLLLLLYPLSPYQYQFKRWFIHWRFQFRRRCARTSSDRLFLPQVTTIIIIISALQYMNRWGQKQITGKVIWEKKHVPKEHQTNTPGVLELRGGEWVHYRHANTLWTWTLVVIRAWIWTVKAG